VFEIIVQCSSLRGEGKELQFELDADGVIVCDQAYEKKTTPKWRYDLGRKKNFEQVGSLQ
jgi:hypothetical protein